MCFFLVEPSWLSMLLCCAYGDTSETSFSRQLPPQKTGDGSIILDQHGSSNDDKIVQQLEEPQDEQNDVTNQAAVIAHDHQSEE